MQKENQYYTTEKLFFLISEIDIGSFKQNSVKCYLYPLTYHQSCQTCHVKYPGTLTDLASCLMFPLHICCTLKGASLFLASGLKKKSIYQCYNIIMSYKTIFIIFHNSRNSKSFHMLHDSGTYRLRIVINVPSDKLLKVV